MYSKSGDDVAIITPGAGMCKQLRDEGYKAYTYDSAIIHDLKAKTLLFDEYAHEMYGKLLYIYHVSGAQKAICVGDTM